MYSFDYQLAKGEKSESYLDRFFSQWYTVSPVGMEQQRMGIDRVFVNEKTGGVSDIEYKTDWRASKTGNAFVETVSVDRTNKPGWAYSSQADFLMYYIPGDELIYVIEFEKLRKAMPRWLRYPEREIPNNGYNTIGILVPLDEFERIAVEVISL